MIFFEFSFEKLSPAVYVISAVKKDLFLGATNLESFLVSVILLKISFSESK
jgi:hypothetical protein